MENIKFWFDGCDISFVVEAPADITLKELLVQADKIKPDWCACGIRSLKPEQAHYETDIYITKDSVRLANEGVSASIKE